MLALVQDQFAPITSAVGFIEAPLEVVGLELQRWHRSLRNEAKIRGVQGLLPEVLHELEPLMTTGSTRELLLETRSSWIAYFDNVAAGTDPMGPVSYLCGVIHCRGVIASYVPHTLTSEARDAEGRYGGVQFSLVGPEETDFLNFVRSIEVVNDGGPWVFNASGSPQPFEEPERYTARRIRDRFTPEMLERYCAALGVRYFEADYYGPNGLMVECLSPLPFGAEALTLAEAQKRYGVVSG
jgi:hypothetical protein